MDIITTVKGKLSSFQIIILGFAGVILGGAVLLMLPISSKAHQVTPFIDALFAIFFFLFKINLDKKKPSKAGRH